MMKPENFDNNFDSREENPESQEGGERFIDGVVFRKIQMPSGQAEMYEGYTPEGKVIKYDLHDFPNGIVPSEDRAYRVRIIGDTMPDDSAQGIYYVEIVAISGEVAGDSGEHRTDTAETRESQEKIFESVVFEPIKQMPGVFASSAMDRKRIRFNSRDAGGMTPEPGKPYRVRVLSDSKPEDPMSGVYEVEIIGEGEAVTDWKEVEKNVSEAEPLVRQARQASSERYKRFGTPDEYAGNKSRLLAKLSENEAAFGAGAEELLGSEGSPERELVALQRENLVRALREERAIAGERAKLLAEEIQTLRGMGDTPTSAELEVLDEVRSQLESLDTDIEALYQESPEAFYGLHLKQLKEFKENLESGKIVEIPYVQDKIENVVTHMVAGKPVMIYGHLGSGKTELAMHVARKYIGKEALVISGSKDISLAELYGHQVLKLDKIDTSELDAFGQQIEEKFAAWSAEHPDATEADKDRAHDTILQTNLTVLKSGTITDYFLGPIYRAMEEGRPVIVDELNAIPHEILISLNHILTRKTGDVVNVQQNSGKQITIAEGYGVLMTGNLNQGQDRYVGRQDMDPAFLSRLHKVDYDYPPQKIEGSVAAEGGEENELFQILLAKVMDKNGNIEVPGDSMQKLWRLAQAARVTQDVFSGKDLGNNYYFKQAGGGRGVRYMLKESVLSLRSLNAVISQWQKEGYKRELDHYIMEEFINQSTEPADRAFLYQLFKDRFDFFSGNGWEQNPQYGTAGNISTFAVKSPQNKSVERTFYGPRDTVKFAFGDKAPRRIKTPAKKIAE